MNTKFNVMYQAEDGYVSGSRPQRFSADPGVIEEGMSDDDLSKLYDVLIQEHFEQHVYPSQQSGNRDAFIAWARQVISGRDA